MALNRLAVTIAFALIATFMQSQELVRVWLSDGEFDVPESVLCSSVHQCLFVSNISGNPSENDGKGFISKLDWSGKVLDLKWVEGLSAPKGMAVDSKYLYVSDIDELVVIDIKLQQIHNRIKKEDAKFLNDVAISADGQVFVSDMGRNQILKLQDDKLEVWMEGEILDRVNGLYCDGKNLIAGTFERLLKISMDDQNVEVILEGTPSIDGVEADGKGGYYYSSWDGLLFHVNPGEKAIMLLNTTEEEINCADIGYNKQNQNIYVPTFFNNRVVAYKWGD